MAATAIIIISYAILLVKLKPSITKEEPDLPSETQISVKPQKSSKEPGTKVESKKVVQTKAHAENAENEEKQKENKDEKGIILSGVILGARANAKLYFKVYLLISAFFMRPRER